MSDGDSPDYKQLYLEERKRREQAECEGRKTTFQELLYYSHKLLWSPLKVETPSRSTTGTIPLPTGKYCPTRLEPWEDCHSLHLEIYESVCRYLQPANGDAPRLFPSLIELNGLSRRIENHAISSELDLEIYEQNAVENHVRDVISELCKIPAARLEFGLQDGIRIENHTNSLEKDDTDETASQPSSIRHPRSDRFCIHGVDSNTSTLLTSGEIKPPHKLPSEIIRLGLRPMNLWDHLVDCRKIPRDQNERLRYNAERLVCSAIVQQYHVMIQEGLAIAFLTNGFCLIALRIPHDDPSTLQYRLFDPSTVTVGDHPSLLEPNTALAVRLCLYLLSCRFPIRTQRWRKDARTRIRLWHTSFDHVRSQIPKDELGDTLLHYDSTDPDQISPDHSAEFQPSSSPAGESPTSKGRRVPTRSQTCRTPSVTRQQRSESPESSGSDRNLAPTGRKRNLSQVSSSPSTEPASRPQNAPESRGSQHRQHDAKFCTLRCLLGLLNSGTIDDKCPNVKLHQGSRNGTRHPITAKHLVHSLQKQLDQELDHNCTPLGHCGESGAPFKLTCAMLGYTVLGKGTTRCWRTEVAREAEAYQILKKAQASAVPVFLGTIKLAEPYLLHGAGEIRHMLLMGWGGKSPRKNELDLTFRKEIKRSVDEIRSLGVYHLDLRRENILWSPELQRALIIDFHRSKLVPRQPVRRRPFGGPVEQMDTRRQKRLRVV